LNLGTGTSNVVNAPTQGQVRAALSPLEIQHHFFPQCAQKFLAITVGSCRRSPHLANIGTASLQRLQLRRGDGDRTLLLPSL
jgi:hypothetical protein